MAAAIAATRFGRTVVSQSVGIECGSGMRAAANAVRCMAERGVDISQHRSSDIGGVDCAKFDILVAMSPSIADELRRVNPTAKRVILWDIPDPYGSDLETYRRTALALEKAIETLEL